MIDIFKDQDTTFMVVAAIRYCQGRRTYAPSLMCDWVKKYWNFLDKSTQDLIRKEANEYIESDRYKGDDCDMLTWKSFANWLNQSDQKRTS